MAGRRWARSAACALVLAAGAIAHRPLSRVPENTLKFGVGVMLSAFGVFWTGEGLGIDWPGGDLALLGLRRAVSRRRPSAQRRWCREAGMSILRECWRELFGMFVADARLTIAILVVIAVAAAAVAAGWVGLGATLLVAGSVAVLVASVMRAARRR